jgi:hypothetical protein
LFGYTTSTDAEAVEELWEKFKEGEEFTEVERKAIESIDFDNAETSKYFWTLPSSTRDKILVLS